MRQLFDGVERRTGYVTSQPVDSDPSLLQLASELAGEPWTDRTPTCVHPALGAIARAVYDQSSLEGRSSLRPLAGDLIGTAVPGFDLSARLVATCVSTALASPDERHIGADERKKLCAARHTALYLLSDDAPSVEQSEEDRPRLCGRAAWWVPVLGWVRLSEPFYRCLVAPDQAAEAVVITGLASGADRDRRLRQLLKLSIAVSPSESPSSESSESPSTESSESPSPAGLTSEWPPGRRQGLREGPRE